MKKLIIGSLLGTCMFFLTMPGRCQDKPNPPKDEAKSTEAQAEGPQVKVQIVFAEYEGDKKVKSLPYTMLVQSNRTGKLRIGSRVPVATGGDKGGLQFQYIDVGTNLDCLATPAPESKYQLRLSLERSWVEGNVPVAMEKSATASPEHNDSLFRQPIIHQFRFDDTIFLRDGQTLETNFATDPVSGKVIKVEVTLNVLK